MNHPLYIQYDTRKNIRANSQFSSLGLKWQLSIEEYESELAIFILRVKMAIIKNKKNLKFLNK